MIHHKKDDNTKNNKLKSHIQELGHKTWKKCGKLKITINICKCKEGFLLICWCNICCRL
jgi:hypothetical protein